jgi:hypothetical protein
MRVSASFTSASPFVSLRWATLGMRRASASNTEDAFAVPHSSSASPPESIRTTMVATRYSHGAIAVSIETPAGRSEPNSRLNNFFRSSHTMGTPPISSAADRGMSLAGAGKCRAYFSRMCKSIASSANPALRFLWWEQNPAGCSGHYLNLSHFLGYESKVRHCCDWPIFG